ncbi:MAG: PEP-CTERM sorting domain-containing protein [Armatimonadetes bacterium]|nr:PEP-CTERM sorting domain-containing protein [Armatimonadota bacterium]
MRISRILLAATAAVAAMSLVNRVYAGDVLFSGSAGNGANTSYLVIDSGTYNFAFTYHYDGAKTAADMLTDLDAGVPGLDIGLSDYGGGSIFVDTFAYPPMPVTGTFGTYWSYWLSDDGAAWNYSQVGAGQRVLSDGSWDGWSFVPSFTTDAVAPRVPTNPVPEPSSVVALLSVGTGVIAMLRKRG